MATSNESSVIIASMSHKLPANCSGRNVTLVEDAPSSGTSKRTRKNPIFRLAIDGFKLDYVGKCPTSAGGSDWCVAVVNRTTKQVHYKPARFLMFSPQLASKTNEELEKSTIVDKSNFRGMRDLLTLKYGSKQKKRALEARMASAITKDSLSNMINVAVTQVKQSAEESFTVKSELNEDGTTSTPTKRLSSVLPPFNPHATSPGEIYDLNDLVSPDDAVMMNEDAAALASMSTADRKSAGLSSLVLDLCHTLPSQVDARRTRCVYMLYLHYLLSLCKVAAEKRMIGAEDLLNYHVNSNMIRVVFDRYTEPARSKRAFNKRGVSAANKDKLLAHCAVLLLSLNQFTFNLTQLLTESGSDDKKLSTICRLLGCQVKKTTLTGEKSVTLTTPPKETNPDAKRRRTR